MLRAQPEPGHHPLSQGPAAIAAQQELLITSRVGHGRVAHRIDSSGNGAIDLAQRNFVAQQDRRLETCAAGALQIQSRRLEREPASEHRLPRQIPLTGMLHHCAGCNVVNALSAQAKALDHAAQRGSQHLLISDLRVGAVAPCERDPCAADNCDAPRTCSYQHGCLR